MRTQRQLRSLKVASFEDFDRLDGRKVAGSIADWLEQEAGHPVRDEKVDPGDEQILPPSEQRDLDALPSRLSG